MPVPRWVARMNKRIFNPRELKKGKRPILAHVGRRSGATHRTPLDAHPIDGGFLFIPNYGPQSDWVLNILASGSATLSKDGVEYSLTNPRLIDLDEARSLVADDVKVPPPLVKIDECLRMDIARG